MAPNVEAYTTLQERERFAPREGSKDTSHSPRNADFPRSASYTYLPVAKDSAYSSAASLPITIKGSFSEDDLIGQSEDSADISPPDSTGYTTPIEEEKVPADISKDLIAELQKSSKVTVSRFLPGSQDESDAEPSPNVSRPASTYVKPAAPPTPDSNVSRGSLVQRLSRRISYGPVSTPSRSPSPTKKAATIRQHQIGNDGAPTPPPVALVKKKSVMRRRDSENKNDAGKAGSGLLGRKGTLLRRKSTKRPSELKLSDHPVKAAEDAPPVPSFPKSFSTDKLPSISHHSAQRAAPSPRLYSGEKVPTLSQLSLQKKRDELWTVFRSLDGDYTKFQSKSSAFKANVVRSSLLHFLRNYATHPSNLSLRPEDLDRRANIFNKWWTGLIEMLHGRNNQSISGTDRPAILDGLSGIMERPEWRLAPSPFCPVARRSDGPPPSRNKSVSSMLSSSADFLAESVYQNVRNIFVQNLNAQMAFVVDKMSLRNASASLVTFCGKASAYAFFFCPGIADVLVRLWDVPMDGMRRVLEEHGVGKFERLPEISAEIIAAFPPALQNLGFVSLTAMMRTLRTPPPLPLGTANIQWYGYWLERWSGRESDLFYAFVKQYHILVTDFLPPNAPKKERIAVPGLLLVQSQILSNMDSTVHRDSKGPQNDGPNEHIPTFDDLLGEPDAVASTLPLPPTNAVRVMAENRLIMLIRDFLSDRTSDHPIARHLFAESFNGILHACAKRTSVYDHSACYTLCDFLEEALVILVRYEQLHSTHGPLIDIKFWLQVCRKMIDSENTMTEIRLFAFLYTCWPTIASDMERKRDLCLDLLLNDEVFERTFNHWCPMVRAYYMRILCWRVGRLDGEASEQEISIIGRLYQLLQSTWSQYGSQKQAAEEARSLLPSTAPCNPAPGRRLLIIRTDTHIATGSFLTFDNILPGPSAHNNNPAYRRNSTMSQLIEIDPLGPTSPPSDTDYGSEPEGGLRGFLRNMLGSSRSRPESRKVSRTPSRASSPAVAPSPSASPALSRSTTDDPRVPRARSSASKTPNTPGSQTPTYRSFSFKFSLEFHPKMQAKPPGPMRVYAPRLPAPAQQALIASQSAAFNTKTQALNQAVRPSAASIARSKYVGRALAEWSMVVGECQGFFDRRRNEGVPDNRLVETPTLGVEVFKRPA